MVVVSPGRVDRKVSCCEKASGEMFEEGPRPCPYCDEDEEEEMVVAAKVVLWLSILPDNDEEEVVVLGYGALDDSGKG